MSGRDGERAPASAALGALTPVAAPLDLATDSVVDYSPALDDARPREQSRSAAVHLRVWEGAAPEGRRVVVLLGVLTGQVLDVASAVREVVTRWLPTGVGPGEVAWAVHHHEGPRGRELPAVEALQLAWAPGAPGEARGRLIELVQRLSTPPPTTGSRPGTPVSWWLTPTEFAALAAVIGTPVALIPAALYTPDTLARLQQAPYTGAPLEVRVDPAGIEATCEALAVLDGHRDPDSEPDPARRDDASAAAEALAEDLRARLSLELGATGADPDPPPGARWAARAVSAAPDRGQAALLARDHDRAVTPRLDERDESSTSSATSRAARRDRLWEWAEDVGAHAERPDPALEVALRRAAGQLADDEVAAGGSVRPASELRVFRVCGPVERGYLDELSAVDAPGSDDASLRRRARALAARLPPVDRVGLLFGLDPADHLVVYTDLDVAGGQGAVWFALEWPLRVRASGVTGGTLSAVADADPDGGDRPVFLARSDGRREPLPAGEHGSLRASWRFGTGAAVGALAGDLATVLATGKNIDDVGGPDGETVRDPRVHPWWLLCRAELEVALADSAHDHGLRLPLAPFCR